MSKRILLADDSLTIQKVVELTFMDEDFEVDAVGSGDEAINRLGGDLPNIVIADVHMPGASGYEVCRQAKRASADLPVLLLVGTFEALDEDEMVACGADGNLKKPFDSQELLQVVRRMTSGPAPTRAAEPVTEFGSEPAVEQIEGLETTSHEEVFGAESAEPPVTGFDLGGGALEDASSLTRREAALAGLEADLVGLDGEPELAPVDLGVDLSVDLGVDLDEDLGTEPGGDPSADSGVDGGVDAGTDSGWPEGDALEDEDMFGSGNETVLLDALPADEAESSEVVETVTPDEPEPAQEDPSAGSVGLSDADVDRVARRVVELMSDDAVREIAWDVIPDMAEIVIKARVRELELEAEAD